jgi:hypothetical protein
MLGSTVEEGKEINIFMALSRSLNEYEENGGWSSSNFFQPALSLMKALMAEGHKVEIGRTVVHLDGKLKCYVHHNGRSREYATVTDFKGNELFTAHYTQFQELEKFIRDNL